MKARIEALRRAAAALRLEASALARDAYEHPRQGLWIPLSAVASELRTAEAQAAAAVALLDTWGHERKDEAVQVRGSPPALPDERSIRQIVDSGLEAQLRRE